MSETASNRFSKRVAPIVATVFVCLAGTVLAYETDQFTNRDEDIADSTAVLNREVNRSIRDIAANWRKGHDEVAFVGAVYNDLGGRHWVDKLERWAMKSPEVDKLSTRRYRSVFSKMPPGTTRFARTS